MMSVETECRDSTRPHAARRQTAVPQFVLISLDGGGLRYVRDNAARTPFARGFVEPRHSSLPERRSLCH
jgi:hypothetical protein